MEIINELYPNIVITFATVAVIMVVWYVREIKRLNKKRN